MRPIAWYRVNAAEMEKEPRFLGGCVDYQRPGQAKHGAEVED